MSNQSPFNYNVCAKNNVRKGMKMKPTTVAIVIGLLLNAFSTSHAQNGAFRPPQQTAIDTVDRIGDEIKSVNKAIWEYAEIGLQEHRSSALLVEHLNRVGFHVETGVAGMPTAFVASYGSGKPVIALLAEYDALPGMSQKVSPQREAVQEGAPGHACGHSGLGSGSLAAALAVKAAMEQHDVPGTIRLYGTPAEETVIGKIYMTIEGLFNDVDVCIHWHPKDKNQASTSGSKALISAKFTFAGTPSHASGTPEAGRSALDAVELMNVGANYMREHIKDDARIHYVITDGGGAPNVVPPTATVWYFCRADDHNDAERNFKWLNDIAEGAAKMTRTKVSVKIDTDCHELIVNQPLSDLINDNLEKVGPPSYTDEEILFARRLQQPLMQEFGMTFKEAIDSRVHRKPLFSEPTLGSTDVGDISWNVPTGGLGAVCFVDGSPGHSWQNVAAIGSTIGEKGILYAGKVMAVTALDLMHDPQLIAAARADWMQRMKDRKYTTLIPKGQKAPSKIR